MHHFIMKIQNKRKLNEIVSHNSSDIDFKDFMNVYKKYTRKKNSFLVIDASLHQIILYVLERTLQKEYKK